MKRPLFLIDHIPANVFKWNWTKKHRVDTGFIRARQVDKKYWSENLKTNADYKGIQERCHYMSELRNTLKVRHGQLISDYTLLIDCDVIFPIDIIDRLVGLFSSYNFYVGPSKKNSITVDLPTRAVDCECIPTNKQQPNWTDAFDTSLSDNKLTVRRIDTKNNWGQQLEFKLL